MAGSGSFELHEDVARLKPETIDQHRAIVSVMEELEAVDWYGQRVEATDDDELRAVLAHNRDEEIEHAAMVIEWLRRRNAVFDAELRTYLWSEGPITEVEAKAEAGEAGAAGAPAPSADGSLGIGSLKGGIR
ncbi:MAG: encapsulin-associated ferritin-like protein [Alphaproteobacteria bacterium]